MKRSFVTLPAMALAALTFASGPVFAQEHERGRRASSSQGSHEQHANQGSHEQHADQPRGGQDRGEHAVPRAERPEVVAPRVERPEVVAPRVERPVVVAPRVERPAVVVPREVRPNVAVPRVVPRYEYRDRYAYRGYPYVVHPVIRPYVFRPRLQIGLGFYLGYPVPYTWSYPYPIQVYGYRGPVAPVVVGPGSNVYGGVSLEIWPDDAAVYVDGAYAGIVRDFDGTREPLTMVAGTHRIEIQGAGYAPLVFDVNVQPGQVIPYQGQLQPY